MKQEDQLVRRIETHEAIVGLRHDGIVHVYYKPDTEITITLQEKMMVIFNEITGQKKSLFIFQAAERCSVTKDARENAIRVENETPTKATVVYVTTLAYRLIAEFYYKFNKPRQPYKVVSDFEDGIEWLLDVEKEMNENHSRRR